MNKSTRGSYSEQKHTGLLQWTKAHGAPTVNKSTRGSYSEQKHMGLLVDTAANHALTWQPKEHTRARLWRRIFPEFQAFQRDSTTVALCYNPNSYGCIQGSLYLVMTAAS